MTRHKMNVTKNALETPKYLKIVLLILLLSVPVLFIMADNMICGVSGSESSSMNDPDYFFSHECYKPWFDRFFNKVKGLPDNGQQEAFTDHGKNIPVR